MRNWVPNERSPTTKSTRPRGGVSTVARHEPHLRFRAIATDSRQHAGSCWRWIAAPGRWPTRTDGSTRTCATWGSTRRRRGHGRPRRPAGSTGWPSATRPRMPASSLGLADSEPIVDCLVFADSLEHMIDPWGVLARLSRWVREGGRVSACDPQRAALYDAGQPDAGPLGLPPGLAARNAWNSRFFGLSASRISSPGPASAIFEVVPRLRGRRRIRPLPGGDGPAVRRELGINAATFFAQTRDRVPRPVRPGVLRTPAHADLVDPGLGP